MDKIFGLNYKVMPENNWVEDLIDLHVSRKGQDGKREILKELIFTPLDSSVLPDDKVIRLEMEAAQLLMDGLWRLGVRPTDDRERTGVLFAKNMHIEDLRKVLDAYLNNTRRP